MKLVERGKVVELQSLWIKARRQQGTAHPFDRWRAVSLEPGAVVGQAVRRILGGSSHGGEFAPLPSPVKRAAAGRLYDPLVADDLTLALELADLADGITMGRYRAEDLAVETKPDETPVTEVDQATERALRERLAQERPDDVVLGEEFGEAGAPGSARRWIIDPIDGTKSYLRGMPTWTTLIALQIDGEPEIGVVSAPAISRRWWAQREKGAFAVGRPIHVSSIAALSEAQLAWGGIEDWDAVGRTDALLALGRACWRTRGIGDAVQYMLVAEGAAEIALDPEASLWDLAAVQIVVEQAGGRFSDLSGTRSAAGGDGIATNGQLHRAALAVVGR